MLFSIIECSITSLAINLLLPSWHLTCSCSQAICNAVFPIRSCLLIWMKIRVSNSISCKLKKKKRIILNLQRAPLKMNNLLRTNCLLSTVPASFTRFTSAPCSKRTLAASIDPYSAAPWRGTP